MGECSFGHGFGQTNPESKLKIDEGVDARIWKSIPHAIFNGMTKRYRVCLEEQNSSSFQS